MPDSGGWWDRGAWPGMTGWRVRRWSTASVPRRRRARGCGCAGGSRPRSADQVLQIVEHLAAEADEIQHLLAGGDGAAAADQVVELLGQQLHLHVGRHGLLEVEQRVRLGRALGGGFLADGLGAGELARLLRLLRLLGRSWGGFLFGHDGPSVGPSYQRSGCSASRSSASWTRCRTSSL